MRARFIALSFCALVACDSKKNDANPEPAPAASAAIAMASATASASAVVAPAPRNPNAGEWAGKYEAKKGKIDVAKEVKDFVPDHDDGKTAVGPGNVTITIGNDGEAVGKLDGALGDGTISGKIEDDKFSGAIFPNDQAKGAFGGIITGTLAGGAIKGSIRVAGSDATVVREAPFELKKR